jgi:hypothetical protein
LSWVNGLGCQPSQAFAADNAKTMVEKKLADRVHVTVEIYT